MIEEDSNHELNGGTQGRSLLRETDACAFMRSPDAPADPGCPANANYMRCDDCKFENIVGVSLSLKCGEALVKCFDSGVVTLLGDGGYDHWGFSGLYVNFSSSTFWYKLLFSAGKILDIKTQRNFASTVD